MVVDRLAHSIRPNNPARHGNGAFGWSWSPNRSVTGTAVNDDAALSLTAFFRGVSLLAGAIGGLPIQIFEEQIDAEGQESPAKKIKTPDTAYLWSRPNPEMTAQSFWERVVADEVRGNAYIYIEVDELDSPLFLWYIDRNRVRVGRTSRGEKIYQIDGDVPLRDYKQGGEMLHIPNWGGALIGYDPIKVAPQAIALGLSAEEFAARSFGQGMVPPGIITSELPLSPQQSDDLAKRWTAQHSGIRNAGKIAVLGNGAKFQSVATDMEAMQVLTSRTFSVAEIARLLGVPLHLLMEVDHASQGGGQGVEEQNRNFTTWNVNGHINRFQQGVSDDLLVRELTGRYMRMNTSGLLRGNTLQRYQALKMADFLTPNEKRALEEYPPIDGGDTLFTVPGSVPLDDVGKQAMAAEQSATP